MRFQPLHRDFGVEVLDFDVLRSTATKDIEELRAALDRHQLLLFRAPRKVAPDRQIEIAGWFGPTPDNGSGICTVLHNENSAGSRRLPFHSDLTYTDFPIQKITLQAIELPPGGTATAFVSSMAAWDALPAARQEQLARLTLRHRHISEAVFDWPEFIADHPMRLIHPRTGRPVLLVTEHHAHRILELDQAESDKILAELLAHIYAPERVYLHKWALNDLLLWDNLAVQHARPEEADIAQGTRAMQRVATSEVALPELVERARKQQAQRQHAA